MLLVTFYIYRAQWAGRTNIFAGSAADAFAFVHYRELRSFFIVRIYGYHFYGSGRAVSAAVSACYIVHHREAQAGVPYGVSDLYGRLFFPSYFLYGACRANLGTLGAFRAAESAFIG